MKARILTMPAVPVKQRQSPLDLGPAPIADELRAQLTARDDRRRSVNRRQRPKATYDLPEKIQDQVARIAAQENIPLSDVVALAITRFSREYATGEIDLQPMKRGARSLKFAYRLEIPDDESNRPGPSQRRPDAGSGGRR